MNFLNRKSGSKSTITFTSAELKKLKETEHSCVVKVTEKLHLTLLPFHLSNISSSISEILSSNITKYNKDLDGILLGYKNVRVLDSTPAIHNDNCLVHVTVDADFYLFKPCKGKTLIGLVNQISDDHIGCLVHKAFNVVVPKEENGRLVRKNQHILVKVSYTNLEAKLPYIKADLISVVSDSDSGISTSEENNPDTSVSQDVPAVFSKKNKSSKKAKRKVVYEEEEDVGTSKMYLVNDETIDEIRPKKKKSKKKRHDQEELPDHDSIYRTLESHLNEYLQQKNNPELLPQKNKKKKHKKEKFSYDEPDNHSTEPLESSEKSHLWFDKESDGETDQISKNEEIVSPKFKILQNITITKPDQKIRLKENSTKNRQDVVGKDFEDSSEDARHSKKKRKHKNVKKDFNVDTIDEGHLKHKLLKSNVDDLNKSDLKKEKHENTLHLIQDLKRRALESISDDDTKIIKHKKSKKYYSEELSDTHKTEDDSTIALIEQLKRKALKSTQEEGKKSKKHKKHKQDSIDEPKDDTFNLVKDLKRKAFENALGASEREVVESTLGEENKKIKRKKSNSFDNENLVKSNDNTIDLIEDLKRKAIESALGEVNKKTKHKKLQKLAETKDLKNISDDSHDTHIANIDVDSKSKRKVKKAKKCDTNDVNLIEPEIDDIRRKALSQALSKIRDSPEVKTQKKKKKKHKDELDINELKSQTLQKILGNLNEDEKSSHSKKKKKEKDDIDIDKMKEMAINKLLDKKINNNENDSSEEEEMKPSKRHKKGSKKREKTLEILTSGHMVSDDQSKHKVKKKKREKD